jgi:hypothetical protein
MLHPRSMPEFLRFAETMIHMMCTPGCSLDDWHQDIYQTRLEMFVRGATWHLEWWEAEMRLAPRSEDTLEERQDRIIARMRAWRLPTAPVINRISLAYRYGTVWPVMDYPNHFITYWFVDSAGRPSNIEDLEAELDRITPARLGLAFGYLYLTWGPLRDWSLAGGGENGTRTWQRLIDEGFTWDSLKLTLPSELPQ